jgi:hypothetical protein
MNISMGNSAKVALLVRSHALIHRKPPSHRAHDRTAMATRLCRPPRSPLFARLGTNFPTYKRLTAGTQTIFFSSRGACGTQHFPSISASFARVANLLKC